MNRRSFFGSLAASLGVPAVVRAAQDTEPNARLLPVDPAARAVLMEDAPPLDPTVANLLTEWIRNGHPLRLTRAQPEGDHYLVEFACELPCTYTPPEGLQVQFSSRHLMLDDYIQFRVDMLPAQFGKLRGRCV